jgi:phosphate transport system substrate-binding protein
VVAIGLAVSPDVAANLTDISTTDLKGIFTGAITDWSQVAGWKAAELPITVYYHGQGSGTRIIFEAYGVLSPLNDEQISALPNFIQLPSAAGLDQLLGAAKGAIGYAAYPYCSNLSLLSIDGMEVSYDNVYSGKYKLWACEHLYTKGEPTGPEAAFVEFLKAEDFEKTITENGYGLISEMRVSR